ncbi:MAG: 23S rRNA (uridine(2552)-2'-O)-methyltransferase RlmE [Pseudomonadota bacterium]|jgi:23S rRNA (uridine2552-2'-O)-methyltransferase|nr:MAG: 23S rRNA (uridine(2552)-2'-O)-methyltransferase RlmE [Pseudomonadota bacterium]
MARSKSSASWLARHVNDPYVKRAQKEGYRSRAAYKLLELNEKDRLIRPGMRVLDLGSSPGGWSQVAARLVGPKGKVLATDILPMDAIPNVDFIQGDFREEEVLRQIEDWLGGARFDLVLSDMAPNISGIAAADQAASMYLLELALDTARRTLKSGASFVAKMFQGAGSDQYIKELRAAFDKVQIRKPGASRKESREVYLVARGFRGARPAPQ